MEGRVRTATRGEDRREGPCGRLAGRDATMWERRRNLGRPSASITSMSSRTSYLAVVPAYNEADTVVGVVHGIREHAPRFDVLVVDDGSTDGTGDVAQDAGALVLRHPFNLGIGGAVQSGFVFALEHGYDYMV